MRFLAVLAAAGCTMTTDVSVDNCPNDQFIDEHLTPLEEKIAMLDACQEGDVMVRNATGWTCASDPDCPSGFAAMLDGSVAVCRRTVNAATDEMVKAGDTWIDRYEMSQCPGVESLGVVTGYGTTAKGCSSPATTPLASISWFQAAMLCANAGKHLCSNSEWQTAVSGTPDPGSSDGTGGACLTQTTQTRMTGSGSACRSRWGAEDLIGNLWEWTADWAIAGEAWQTSDGQGAQPWPTTDFRSDGTWGVNGKADATGAAVYMDGAPAAMLRGGGWSGGTTSGAFALSMALAPSGDTPFVGARCCKGR